MFSVPDFMVKRTCIEALPGVLGSRRVDKGIYSRENKGTKAKFCGEIGNKAEIGEQ